MIRKWLVIFISLTPWVLSLFLHYWLEYEKVWSVDMPYRALVSAILIFFGAYSVILIFLISPANIATPCALPSLSID